MPIIAKAQSDFRACPEGTFRAVCVDVVDLGEIDDNYGGKARKVHKIRIAWQVDELMDDGRPFIVSELYTLSFGDKANLRKMVEGWLVGTKFGPDIEFDVETLIGRSCLVTVKHRDKDGKTYANVKGVAPMLKGMPGLIATDYQRVKDRPVTAKPAQAVSREEQYDDMNPPPPSDQDLEALPF